MTTKTYYLYDPRGVVIGTYKAQESPLEPGVYIVPIHATDIAPPGISAKQAAVFSQGAWTVVPDYRGETWYDQVTGALVEIVDVGNPAQNLGANPLPVPVAPTPLVQDPVTKLREFLAANPDVVALVGA